MIDGYEICEKAEKVKTGAQDKPLVTVKIVDCGELKGEEKLTSETAKFMKTYSVAPKEGEPEEEEGEGAEDDQEEQKEN